jgi:Family of unknown function (DUF5996)
MSAWLPLPYAEWKDTLDTLHMELQVLGKVRLARSPKEPAWAHVALYVTPRGLATGIVPFADGIFEVEADFVDHRVVVRTSADQERAVPLVARPVSEFYVELTEALRSVGVDILLTPMPQEVPDPIPFPADTVHRAYQPDYAHRFWRILTLIAPVFDDYRASSRGRVSRVQFFWGSMDLNVTRFSGRPASPPPDADLLLRDAHDAEQVSVGFWPGTSGFPEPAFFAYGYPKPDGIEAAPLRPPAASWNRDLGELVLRYEDVRAAPSPPDAIRDFLDSAYEAVSRLNEWPQPDGNQ